MSTGGTESAGTSTSTWAPLQNTVFRGLFLAALVSNIGTWMQTVGAQWFLVESHASATAVALVQTASLSPTIVLTLFAGALADRVDRRRLLILVQVYAAAAAAVLTAVALAGALRPTSLLCLIFAIGCAAALTTPAWQAIQPEVVPREQVPAATTLSGVAVDAARAIGPPIAGVLVAFVGSAMVFALNAVSFLAVVVALVAWKRPPAAPVPAREPHAGSVLAGLRYLREHRSASRILLRAAMFTFPASALWALLPLVAREHWDLRAIGYGVVLGLSGAGAMLGVLINARLRAALATHRLLAVAAMAMAAALVASAYFPLAPAVVLLLLSGVAWMSTLTILTAAAQLVFPPWMRARGLAMYFVVLIGAQALGSLVWGVLASHLGLVVPLTAAAALLGVAAVGSGLRPVDEDGEPRRAEHDPR